MDSRKAGIETLYQDLALAGNLGISANIFLGREAKKKYLSGIVRTLDETFMKAASRQVLNKLNIRFANFEESIEKLSGGQRQAVGSPAMYWQARSFRYHGSAHEQPWSRGTEKGARFDRQAARRTSAGDSY